MKQSDLFKKLLPGFIPLFVFIAADELWGTVVGVIVALVIGVAELIYTWIREKHLDKFVLLDTSLLVILSLVSILLDDAIFFKLKPAFIEAILCAVLAVSVYSPIDIVGTMTQKYMKGIDMNEEQQRHFKKNLRNLLFLFVAHTILVIYSAFYLSKEAWAFISGGLFYILFVVYFGVEYLRQRRKGGEAPTLEDLEAQFAGEEWLPLVEPDGKIIGKAPRSICHSGQSLLHPVVHLHVLNRNGHIYLQKRPEDKLVQPGKWDTSVGGHIAFGESLETALKREAYEEIGLTDFSARLLGTYRWDSDIESELVYSFISYDFQKIKLHSEEVKEGKFWSHSQIEKQLGQGIFTPNFEHEFLRFKNHFIK